VLGPPDQEHAGRQATGEDLGEQTIHTPKRSVTSTSA
jgi:hypothetical protein